MSVVSSRALFVLAASRVIRPRKAAMTICWSIACEGRSTSIWAPLGTLAGRVAASRSAVRVGGFGVRLSKEGLGCGVGETRKHETSLPLNDPGYTH